MVPLPSSELVGAHRAVELEEAGVPLIGLGEDAAALGVALAAQDLRLALRLGDRHHRLAIGLGADARRKLGAAGAKLRGFGEALGLHALEGLLRDFRQKVGALDADVDDLDADLGGERTQLVAHLDHHLAALLGKRRLEAPLAVDAPQRRIEPRAHVLARDVEAAGDVLAEFPRVGDA